MRPTTRRLRRALQALTPLPGSIRTVVTALAMVAAAAVSAATLDEGMAAYRAGNHAEAFRILDELALDGNVEAQEVAGRMHEEGLGTPVDLDAALELYRLAADGGGADGAYRLALLYLDGRGVDADAGTAMDWLQRAASLGHPGAPAEIELLYRNGRDGIAPAPPIEWYEKAAAAGDVVARSQLAWRYETGTGVDRDAARALKLYLEAAEQGNADAQASVGHMYHTGTGTAPDAARALHWYTAAAGQGQSDAQNNLGLMYLHGEGIPADPAAALEWFRGAAAEGNAEARNNLGQLLQAGEVVPADDGAAAALFALAADQGLAAAENNLGLAYQAGRGVERDPARAAAWFQRAADQGDSTALGNLGYLYERGLGVQRSYAMAISMYHRSAADGYAYAQRNLGHVYRDGVGTAENLAEALRWYRAAAAQGDLEAQAAADAICARTMLPGCGGTVVVLLEQDDGSVGKVLVQTAGGDVLLDTADEAAKASVSGGVIGLPLDRAEIEAAFAETLAAAPPKWHKYTVYFRQGTTDLVPRSRPVLREVFADVESRPVPDVVVVGHTDRVGSEEDNDRLSLDRAGMIRDRLIAEGLDPDQITVAGRGERELLVRTGDQVHEPRNRRVEITVR